LSALDLGPWDGLLRDLSGGDYARACEIARWPVVEVLHAYMHRLKSMAADEYRQRILVWASIARAGSKRRAPEPPAILSE